MIDQQQIERILQEVKITSISDIVSFIASFVSKTALQPLEDLEMRVQQLERPKGMDRVMIEEVKALVEAMLDQREEAFYRQVDRRCKDNVCSSFEIPENSRRSLNEIDFLNIANMQRGTQSQQLRKNNIANVPSTHPRLDNLHSEVRELRQALLSKPDRKELQQIRSLVSRIDKELISKISFEETQKLVLKFERDIFVNLNERRGNSQEIEAKVMQRVHQDMQRLSLAIQDTHKVKITTKIQRKLKHVSQELAQAEAKLNDLQRITSEWHKNSLQNFENMQALIEQFADKKQKDELLSRNDQFFSSQGYWMSAPPSYKNSYVVWEREVLNNSASDLQFESGKTGIRLISAGFYEIGCFVYGGNGSLKKGPALICNSEVISRLDACPNGSEVLPRWRFREFVHVRQNRSTLTVRLEGEQNSSCISLMVRKISF